MKRSPLQIEGYLLQELSFKAIAAFDEERKWDVLKGIEYTVETNKHDKDPYRWRCSLGLRYNPKIGEITGKPKITMSKKLNP